jgi:hypothetical protein
VQGKSECKRIVNIVAYIGVNQYDLLWPGLAYA